MSAGGPVVLETMKLLGLEDYWLGSWRHPHKKHKYIYHTHKETPWCLGGPPERDDENAGGTLGRTLRRTLRIIVQFLTDRSPPLKLSSILKDDWCGSGFENMAPSPSTVEHTAVFASSMKSQKRLLLYMRFQGVRHPCGAKHALNLINLFIVLRSLLHSKHATSASSLPSSRVSLHLLRDLDVHLEELGHASVQAHTLALVQVSFSVVGGYALFKAGLC
jgi:hypothetical protein